ncbi:PLDc_N domain-containing protein [Nakamurella flava]|uniref:PLDc_N domain-containing protein n=2 Tax=Nakamurella flava TaxID=2576308 RepID=A0A4U6QJW0_9ACTN|nr:PLDc_N domain-containing protein [Nakamurella flava]
MTTSTRKWQDMSPSRRAGLAVGTLGQLALLGAALRSLSKRSAAELNGPRALWIAVSFVNFVGPITYFVLGRRRSTDRGSEGAAREPTTRKRGCVRGGT